MSKTIETEPTPELSAASSWQYVETKTGAHVFAGPFTVRAHWSGGVTPEEIRSLMRAVAAVPSLYAALKTITDQMEQFSDDEYILSCEPLIQSARAALALAETPIEGSK